MRSATTRHWTGKGEFFEEASIAFKGKRFTSGGASVYGGRAAGYLQKPENVYGWGTWHLTSWDGKRIGPCRITSTWKTPRSYVSSTMVQAECFIGGKWYTGRGGGDGLLWNGKLKKHQ